MHCLNVAVCGEEVMLIAFVKCLHVELSASPYNHPGDGSYCTHCTENRFREVKNFLMNIQ